MVAMKFTAPGDSVYQINFSYLQLIVYQSYVALIKLDATVYSEVHASHESYDQLSKTILIEKKVQTVWVR